MEIQELKRQKRLMEQEMRDALQGIVERFREKTGYTPSEIDVRLVDRTAIGQSNPDRLVAAVRTEVDIWAG